MMLKGGNKAESSSLMRQIPMQTKMALQKTQQLAMMG